jgi:broad specificity phosphatase PhoE
MYFKRIKPFIEEIIKKHKNKTVVVIAHSWVGRLFRFYFLNENPFALTLTPINCEPIEFKI